MSCLLDEGPDPGQHVCYFTQPGSVSPLSMTCTVGDCLYEGGDPIVPPDSDVVVVARASEQMAALLVFSALILGLCAGFDAVTRVHEWATAPPPQEKNGPSAAGAAVTRKAAGAGVAHAMTVGLLGEDGLGPVSIDPDHIGLIAHDHVLTTDVGERSGTELVSSPRSKRRRQRGGQEGNGHHVLRIDDTGGPGAGAGAGGGLGNGGATAGWGGAASPDAKIEPVYGNFGTTTTTTSASASPVVTWTDLSLWVPGRVRGGKEKQILCSVTGMAGRVEGREAGGGITALMGPSGAGKTSLLNVLARRHTSYSRLEGQVRVEGRLLSGNELQAISGYVTQHDVLPGMMTVREHLLFHAKLRMGAEPTMREKQERVVEVLAELGLADIHDSIIGDEFVRGISGGERRRVSIASELLASPALLFMDEPTTGLDSSNAINVVSAWGV